MKFGTIVADPPWNYEKTSRHDKLSGYSDVEYAPLTTERLRSLPVGDLAGDESVLLLWATWPFVPDALTVMAAWGFEFVTGLPWVKVGRTYTDLPYGVGYWFRGATEPVLVGKRRKSYRTNMVGILAPRLKHSRKPDNVYDLAERGGLPAPYLELFARQVRDGWTAVGNECPDTPGEDIEVSLKRLLVSL